MGLMLRRIPIAGWRKCSHQAAAFESRGEYAAATLLDDAGSVSWWLRNDPPLLRIPSAVGYFEPDFLYARKVAGQLTHGILEIKGDVFWDGEGSDARIKAKAAKEWVRALNAAQPEKPWEFAVVLDTDAEAATSLEDLRGSSLLVFPELKVSRPAPRV